MCVKLLTAFQVVPLALSMAFAVSCAGQEPPSVKQQAGIVQPNTTSKPPSQSISRASEPQDTTPLPKNDDLFPEANQLKDELLATYEPKGPRVLHFSGTMSQQENELIDYTEALGVDMQPAGHAAWITLQGTRGWRVDVNKLAMAIAEAQRTGGILNLGLSLGVGTNGFGQAKDDAVANTSQFDERIDEIADLLRVSGVRVLLRIGVEINGPWKGHHPYTFPKAYRKIVNRFRARDVDNVAFVWCIAPHGDPGIFARDKNGKRKWFPGEEFIDWYGLDVFHKMHFSPQIGRGRAGFDRYYNVANQLLEHARRVGKPVIIGETTPQNMNIPSAREDPRGALAETIWKQWFLPFLAFLDMHPEIKAVTMLPVYWRKTSAWPEWGDSRIHHNPRLMALWKNELARSRWMHLSDSLGKSLGELNQGNVSAPPSPTRRPPQPKRRPVQKKAPARDGR
jgi:hypothetical protein